MFLKAFHPLHIFNMGEKKSKVTGNITDKREIIGIEMTFSTMHQRLPFIIKETKNLFYTKKRHPFEQLN